MCHAHSYHHGQQAVMNISSFHATLLPKESGPGFVNDYILDPNTGDQKAKKLFLPTLPIFFLLSRYSMHSFLFLKFSGLRKSKNPRKSERSCKLLFGPQTNKNHPPNLPKAQRFRNPCLMSPEGKGP